MTFALGTSSCSIASCFGAKSTPNQLTPVMFSPGRLRLGTRPPDRIGAIYEDNGNGCLHRLGRQRRGVGISHEDREPAAN